MAYISSNQPETDPRNGSRNAPKPWPERIVDGVRLGEEAGYIPVNARTVWDAGAILGYCTDTTYDPKAGRGSVRMAYGAATVRERSAAIRDRTSETVY